MNLAISGGESLPPRLPSFEGRESLVELAVDGCEGVRAPPVAAIRFVAIEGANEFGEAHIDRCTEVSVAGLGFADGSLAMAGHAAQTGSPHYDVEDRWCQSRASLR